MEPNFVEEHNNWEDINRGDDINSDDPTENPQQVLKECLDKFKTPDYIMEPGIFTQLKRFPYINI
jgi:negative elongation factor C/D